MSETADVVVVGGGVVGASAAYHLAAAGAGRVLLLERDDAVGTGSTGRCAGGFRHQFSSADQRAAVTRERADDRRVRRGRTGSPSTSSQDGYLFLRAGPRPGGATFLAAGELHAVARRRCRDAHTRGGGRARSGVAVDGAGRRDVLPGRRDRRSVRAHAGLRHRRAARRRRAASSASTVRAFATDGDRVSGVDTCDGPVDAPVVVNAAGPWAGVLAATAGVDAAARADPAARPGHRPVPRARPNAARW